MKLIGITGKAGAGKTTFSNMLEQQHPEVGVIHVDEFFNNIKRKYFKFLMKENKQGEKVNLKSNLRMIIYNNSLLRNILMRARATLISKSVKLKIEELKKEGKTVIIVDDIFLQYQKYFNDLSMVFLIERPFIDRRLAVMERDGVSKKDAVTSDIVHTSKNYRDFLHRVNLIKIYNTKGKEELQEESEQIYRKYLAPFKDRYRVKDANEKMPIKEKDKDEDINRNGER